MDPVTAVQIAGSTVTLSHNIFKACQTIYTFFQDVKRVEETAQEFASEIKALGTAGQVIYSQVKKLAEDESIAGQDEGATRTLFAFLEQQLVDCDRTTKQLQAAVVCLDVEDSDKAGVFRNAVRQIKLNLKVDDLSVVRNRIRTHTGSLQLALLSITINVSYVIPNRVDAQLRPLLDKILRQKEALETTQAEDPIDNDRSWKRSTAALLEASAKVISDGETLYSDSVFGGSAKPSDSVARKSVYGKSTLVHEWIQHADAIDSLASPPSAKGTERSSSVSAGAHSPSPPPTQDATSVGHVADMASTTSFGGMEPGADPEEFYSDDDFEFEATQHAIDIGKSAFEGGYYAECSETLQEALRMVRELPPTRQKICNACDIRYMLGVCYFHLYDPYEAKAGLLAVVENTPRAKVQDDTRRQQVLDAGHLLAQTYIKLGEMDHARSMCQSTLQGRARLLSKTHESYYESVALMSRIIELQGNCPRARIVAGMLPEDRRSLILNKYHDLSQLEGPSKHEIDQSQQRGDYSLSSFSAAKSQGQLQDESPRREASHLDLAAVQTQESGLDRPTFNTPAAVDPAIARLATTVTAMTQGNRVQPSITQKIPNTAEAKAKRLSDDLSTHSEPQKQNAELKVEIDDSLSMDKKIGQDKLGTHVLHKERCTASDMDDLKHQATLSTTADSTAICRVLRLWYGDGDWASLYEPASGTEEPRRAFLRALVQDSHPMEVLRKNPALVATGKKPRVPGIRLRTRLSEAQPLWESPLHLAVLYGNDEIVQELITAGAKANAECVGGLTALHIAALTENLAIADALLAAGSPPDQSSHDFGTPLCVAAAVGCLDVAQLLLRHGAKLTGQHPCLGTAVHLACASGNRALVEAMYSHCNNLSIWAGKTNIMMGKIRQLQRLSQRSFRRQPDSEHYPRRIHNTLRSIQIQSLKDVTPIAIAAWTGVAEVVEFLISVDCDPSVRCSFGQQNIPSGFQDVEMSALDLACIAGRHTVVEQLLGHVKLVRDQDDRVATNPSWPTDEMLITVFNDHAECAGVLLDNGAPLRPSLVGLAIERACAAVLCIFIEHGLSADVTAIALRDRMLSHDSSNVTNGEKYCWSMLLSNVPGVATFVWPPILDHVRLQHGGTLLHNLQDAHTFAIPLLIEAGADINATNRQGETSLMLATRDRCSEVIKPLIEHGALTDLRSNDGRCARDYAPGLGPKKSYSRLWTRSKQAVSDKSGSQT